jgi:hypothetical protein
MGLPYPRSRRLPLRFSPAVPANEVSSSYIATGSIASTEQVRDHSVASQHLKRPEIAYDLLDPLDPAASAATMSRHPDLRP